MTLRPKPGPPVSDEDRIRSALSELYKPEGVEIWLNSPHLMFDGKRAIDLIQAGDTERVWQVVDMLVTGAFG